ALNADTHTTLALGAATQLAVVGFTWMGGLWARAVWPGLVAGAAPLLLPLVVLAFLGHTCADCSPSAVRWCVIACVAGGFGAGLFLGRRPLPDAIASATVATLLGAMGCQALGLAGLLGALVGLLTGAAPILVLRRA